MEERSRYAQNNDLGLEEQLPSAEAFREKPEAVIEKNAPTQPEDPRHPEDWNNETLKQLRHALQSENMTNECLKTFQQDTQQKLETLLTKSKPREVLHVGELEKTVYFGNLILYSAIGASLGALAMLGVEYTLLDSNTTNLPSWGSHLGLLCGVSLHLYEKQKMIVKQTAHYWAHQLDKSLHEYTQGLKALKHNTNEENNQALDGHIEQLDKIRERGLFLEQDHRIKNRENSISYKIASYIEKAFF